MKIPCLLITVLATSVLATTASAQLVLTGTEYTQNFNSIGSGLPTGWSVSTNASINTLGTSATFTTAATSWATGGSGGGAGTDFRNISSDNITYTTTGATQEANSDRALGWRPLSGTAADTRDGAVTLTIANTQGFEDFSLSLELFAISLTSGEQSYVLEYRVGSTGDFTQLGSTYTTPDASAAAYANQVTLTANSITLSALNNQSESVYIRVRGTTTSGTTNLDIIGIDNLSLSYSAVPEPSTYAAILGAVALVGVVAIRRRKKAIAV